MARLTSSLLLVLLLAAPAAAQSLSATEEAALIGSDAQAGDGFGDAVSMSADGTRVISGSWRANTTVATFTGEARIFVRTGTSWTEEAVLSASDGASNDQFAFAVGLSADGTRAIVGVPQDGTAAGSNAGSARIYARTGSTWTLEATLFHPAAAANDYFGFAVALDAHGDRAVIGAELDDTTGGSNAGSAHVFVRSGTAWASEASLVPTDAGAGDAFGNAVAITGDGSRVLIGAFSDTVPVGGGSEGSARVYVRAASVWTPEATLLPAMPGGNDQFGWSVAITSDGTRAVVGAFGDDVPGVGDDVGSANVFVRVGLVWTQEALLLSATGGPYDELGRSVDISDDGATVLVGAASDDFGAGLLNIGSGQVFLRTGSAWAADVRLLSAMYSADDFAGFAAALSADGRRVAIGVDGDDTVTAVQIGSVRVYTLAALAVNGTACAAGATCASGHCVDDVCCDTACGGGAVDCQACSAALTGGAAGTCAAASAGTVCRVSTAACDPAESCDGTATTCGTDVQSCGVDGGGTPGVDGGTPGVDGGGTPGVDSGMARTDAASTGTDAGSTPPSGGGGCSVSVAGNTPLPLAVLVLALALVVSARRARARAHGRRR